MSCIDITQKLMNIKMDHREIENGYVICRKIDNVNNINTNTLKGFTNSFFLFSHQSLIKNIINISDITWSSEIYCL